LGGGPVTFTAGGEYEYGQEDRTGYLNNFGAIVPVTGVQGVLKRNEENTTDTWGIFAQGEWQFLPEWGLTLGLRYTEVKFESDDRFICTTTINTTGTPLGRCSGSSLAVTATRFNPDDSGSITHDAWTPVAGLIYKLSPATNLYANVGKSFETPTLAELAYRPDGGAGLNFGLNPSTSWQYEVGAKAFVGNDTRVNLALFYIDTDDEVVVATNAGGRSTFQNAPGTRRSGAELAIESFLGWGLSGYLSATYLDAEFSDAFRTANLGPVVNSGNNIPGIPNYSVYAQLSWKYDPLGFTAGVEGYWQGKVYVDDLNTETAGSYWLANITAGFQQKWGGLVLSEFVRVNNLFDEDYISAIAVNNANGQFYYPGSDRNYLVGVTASFEF
jgi:iron complex outermembrane receptor protein